MDKIICSGAFFYAQKTKTFLFLQRTGKHSGQWGLVGGKTTDKETPFEGLKRECVEEIGSMPTHTKVIPLELFTSNDNQFQFHTYVVVVKDQFIPKLNGEHCGFSWVKNSCWPKPLHQGLKHTLNDKSIKNKLQTILDLIV